MSARAKRLTWAQRIRAAEARKANGKTGFTVEDWRKAADFGTCAVGEARGSSRRVGVWIGGITADDGELVDMGVYFYNCVEDDEPGKALALYRAIRARVRELGLKPITASK